MDWVSISQGGEEKWYRNRFQLDQIWYDRRRDACRGGETVNGDWLLKQAGILQERGTISMGPMVSNVGAASPPGKVNSLRGKR